MAGDLLPETREAIERAVKASDGGYRWWGSVGYVDEFVAVVAARRARRGTRARQ